MENIKWYHERHISEDTPHAHEFYEYFSDMSITVDVPYLLCNYEYETKAFIIKYDSGGNILTPPCTVELQTIDDIFTRD